VSSMYNDQMPLTTGRRLGPYEIVAAIGAGGMGEVYEGRDTRLGRSVAIKVLPAGLASNPERLARFEREARSVSQLSHPHVCALHDVGEEEGIHFLVLEHCRGETLAARLARGPLPLAEMLRYGAQIAEALDAAHRRGIVHRDLKPANVMLTGSGVKLLDFGLARSAAAVLTEDGSGPTMLMNAERPLTAEGTVLGTWPYMAPEQVEGGEADARSDIFSLGAVLHEMATGRRAFPGNSAASVMAAVLRAEPEPLVNIQAPARTALEHLIHRCLAKDPEERWQNARDVALELRWIAEGASQSGLVAPLSEGRTNRERLAWGLSAALVLLVALLAAWQVSRPVASHQTLPLRFAVPPPEGTVHESSPAISPDGRILAFVAAADDGVSQLWIRPLDSLLPRPLAGTSGAVQPFWSPDSSSLGFFAEGSLKRIDLGSSVVRTLAPAQIPWGGSWSASGVIVYVDQSRGLLRVPAGGGLPVRIPLVGNEPGRLYFWPVVLQNEERFLFSTWAEESGGGLYLGELNGNEPRLLRSGPGGGRVQYDPAGYILFLSREGRGSSLLAQRIDLGRGELTGEPIQVAEEIFVSGPGEGRFSVGPDGLLVLRESRSTTPSQLHWVSASGAVEGTLGPVADWGPFEISADGETVAAYQMEQGLWLIDTRRGVATRLADGYAPVWSPDSRNLVFSMATTGPPGPHVLDVMAGGEAKRAGTFPLAALATDWTPDGRQLLVETLFNRSRSILLHSLESGESEPLLVGEFEQGRARVSPDGRFVAFFSTESGRSEIYVASFPRPGRRFRVSTGGGSEARWSADGRALFHSDGRRITRVPVLTEGEEFRAGDEVVVFEDERLGHWDVAPDGRLLVSLATGERSRPPLIVISDWRAASGIRTSVVSRK
jgi:eukaryotic-like serine/threonine-protein kinase